MKIRTDLIQGSSEWLNARAGLITASEVDSIISPLWKAREGKGVETYAAKKLAEKWLGTALSEDLCNTVPMEMGSILEKEAIPFIEFTTGETIQRVGLVTDDANTCGASPDGLIGEDGGIEIKCPEIKNHVKYLLTQKVPDDYIAQVHFSMFVTGRKWWKFVSYRRNMPVMVLTVNRDEKIQEAIADAVADFLVKLDTGWKTLIRLNDGNQPERGEPMVFSNAPQDDRFDINN